MSPGSLNPVRLFFGPIFQMEVRTAGRRTSTYVFRTLFAALVTLFFAVFLVGNWSEFGIQQSSVGRLQQVQSLAPQLAAAIVWTQYPALLLLAPIIAGPALCDERRLRTLPALLTTPLSAWEIVLGKLSGRLTQALVLGAISLPVMLGARLLGGVSAEGIFAAVLLTTVSVVQIASLALLLSASSSRATAAASAALVVFLFVNFSPSLGLWIYNEWLVPKTGLQPLSFTLLFSTSLPISLGGVTMEHFAGQPSGAAGMQLWGWSIVYGCSVTALSVFAAGLRLRKTMRQDPEGIEIRRKLKKSKRRGSGATTAAGTPALIEESRTSRVVGDRPVLWREIRRGLFRRRRTLVLILLGLALGFALFYINADLGDAPAHFIIAELGVALLLLQAVFATTGEIPHERESRTIDVLLTTPLSASAIVMGKLIGAARRLWLVPLCLLLHFGITVASGYIHWSLLVLVPLAVGPPVFLLLCTGMLAGVQFRRPITAAVANLAVPITVYAMLPFVLTMLESQIWGRSDDTFNVLLSGLVSVNPLAVVALVISGTEAFSWGSSPTLGELEFEIPYRTMGFFAFTKLLLVAGSIQIVIGGLAAFAAARWLPVREGRPS